MRHLVVVAALALVAAAPALADPAGAQTAAPKMKKICRAENNGNPLFPTMKCHSVPVETAAAAPEAAAIPAASPEPATQVAQNGAQPH